MTNQTTAASPNRTLRNFIRKFGRLRLSELCENILEGKNESELRQQFFINSHQISILRTILIEEQPLLKHG